MVSSEGLFNFVSSENHGLELLFRGAINCPRCGRKNMLQLSGCMYVASANLGTYLIGHSVLHVDLRCSQEYWAEHDESGEYPHELHAALSKDGWIGIALPEELGGAGLGISEATVMLQAIAQLVTPS